jgi:hypothetical protein
MLVIGRGRGVGRGRSPATNVKLAVPPPINLPSKKSENKGLDPNTVIVPPGTSGWGSKLEESNAVVDGHEATYDQSSTTTTLKVEEKVDTNTSSRGSASVPSAWGTRDRDVNASGSTASANKEAPVSSSSSIPFDRNSPDISSLSAAARERGFQLAREEFPTLGKKDNEFSSGSLSTNTSQNGSASLPQRPPLEDRPYGPGPNLRPQFGVGAGSAPQGTYYYIFRNCSKSCYFQCYQLVFLV